MSKKHRIDAWRNLATGQGLGEGKLNYAFNYRGRIDEATLGYLYREDSIIARACNTVPKEAMRQGWRWKTSSDDSLGAKLTARLEDLSASFKILKAWTWARLYGGCLLILGCDDGKPTDLPLDTTSLRGVRFLTVLEKQYCFPERLYSDPLSPRYGEPEIYRITTIEGRSVTVHASRTLRFDGVMTTRDGEAENGGWSDSIVRRMYDAVMKFAAGSTALSAMLEDVSVGVFKIQDLPSLLAGDLTDAFKKRIEYMDLAKSVTNSILVDADGEDYTRIEIGALTGVADVYEKLLLAVSQACEIPVTILFGQSPAGLTATGDSDVRWFYDSVKSEQTQILKPALEYIAKLLFLSSEGPTAGVEPESYSVDFPSLWQPSPQEKATIEKTQAETDSIYVSLGVRSTAEVAADRFGVPLPRYRRVLP